MPFFAKPIARGIAAKVKALMIEPNLKRQLDFMEGELAAASGSPATSSPRPTSR